LDAFREAAAAGLEAVSNGTIWTELMRAEADNSMSIAGSGGNVGNFDVEAGRLDHNIVAKR
jgi:hypothetical protein